ncbi:hypothetical protein GGTG_07190 [Gaeumannomyces tritici R3-111a-1]|uniref:Cell wall protein n=1 Tax=Gaeumannomyces tritici (strain R3-111a-1) TaxID=644352 RepID=J3P0Z4_GAET3|nr:hypothetical protein GGTG_07190 [Gaeumannomyces tritici R3-111a-1]EJT77278.1 hypothetical protein GGTG_07190 [Gaeumannomyces tritici R3-111a-1]
MKFSIPAILGLVMGASASAVAPRAAVEARSLEVVVRVMTSVYEHMGRLDDAITKFQGVQDIPGLRLRGGEMVAAVKSADAEVLGMTPVTLQEAHEFQPLSDKLNAMGEKLLGHVVDKIPTFGQVGVCSHAEQMISDIGAGVVKLMGDVAAKFPTDGQGKSNQGIIQHFTSIFADTVSKLKSCAVQVTATVEATSTVPCTTSTGVPIPPSQSLTFAVPATPTPAYPKANGTAVAWPPAPTGTKPAIVTAGAALNGVAKAAVALMAAAYLL